MIRKPRHYYAQHMPYGYNTASDGDTLYRFSSKRKRDEWVCEDFEHRGACTRDDAKRWYPMAFSKRLLDYCYCPWTYEGTGASFDFKPTGGVYADL